MPEVDAFGYEYSLTIGVAEELIKLSVPATNIQDTLVVSPDFEEISEYDYRTEPSRSVEIVDKQLIAEIDNTKDTDSPAVITVYNLTPDQRALVKENSSIILRAGYRSELGAANTETDRKGLPLVYVGQVVSSKTLDNGIDSITEIICSEGRTVLRNLKLTLGWPPGTTYQQMMVTMLELAASKGLPIGRFTGDAEGKTPINTAPPNGYQMAGIFEEELNRLAENIDFIVFMSLGKLYIEPKYVERSVEYVELTSRNIKGTVEVEEDGADGMSGDQAQKNGVILKTYLNGNIATNKFLRLSNLLNPQHEGDYKIESTRHSLNYEGDTWETEISATRLP